MFPKAVSSTEKHPRFRRILTCIAVCTLVLVFSSYLIRSGQAHPDLYDFLLLYLIQPLAFFFLAYELFTAGIFKNRTMLLLFLLVLWYLFCCCADKWVFELKKSEQKLFLYFLVSASVTFPFAGITGDYLRRKILDVFLGVMITACSVFWWIAYAGVANHELYLILNYKFGAQYSETGRLILTVFSMHQYRQGFIASAFAFLVLYLAVSYPKKTVIILSVFLEVTYIPAVLMSGGRTDVFGFGIGVIYVLLLLIYRKKRSRKAAMGIAAGAAAAVTAAAFAGMNLIYRHVTHSIRNVWYGMTTLTSRTDIWGGLFKSYADHPDALWIGYPWYRAMDVINQYIPLEDEIPHMHSSYFQTLAVTGLPGLLLMFGIIACIIINGVRLFRAGEDTGITFKDKLLFTVPLCMIAEGTMELVIFAAVNESIITHALFMLLSGYVVSAGEKTA